MTRPEQHVLDEIDALVNEQLNVGPVDDYNVNRYPDCNRCPHDWHGERCQMCSCEQSTGEVTAGQHVPRRPRALWRPDPDQRGLAVSEESDWHFLGYLRDDEGPAFPRVRNLDIIRIGGRDAMQRQGYTLADIEAMRAVPWVIRHEDESSRYSQQLVRPRIRFTCTVGDYIATTTAEVIHTLTHWRRNEALLELADVHQLFESAEGIGGEYPVVVLEVWRDDDWVGLSTIHRDDMTLRHDMEWSEGGRLREERWTATLPVEAWLVSDP